MPRTNDQSGILSVLMAAANRDDVVNWSKLEEELKAAPAPLSAKGHVSVLLDLANGRKIPASRWNQFVGVKILGGEDDIPVALPDGMLKHVTNNMSVLAEGTARKRADAERLIAEDVSGNVLIAPAWSAEHGLYDRVIARDMMGAVVYGYWLLTDRRSELAGALCRCRYSKCRKFFLKRPGKGGKGAPTRRYCTAKHRELADRENARERMRRKRQ